MSVGLVKQYVRDDDKQRLDALSTGETGTPTQQQATTSKSADASGVPPLVVTDPLPSRSPQVQAWMLRAPVDFVALAAPTVFTPDHWRGFLCLAALGIVLLYSGGRRRARLHLSVLDEAPTVLGAGLVAAAVISVGVSLRHPTVAVADYARWAGLSIVLLLVGRCLTNIVIATARRRRLVRHRTVIIGYGPLGQELRRILDHYPQYGLEVAGVVDDRSSVRSGFDEQGEAAGNAQSVQASGLDRLGAVVDATAADVLIIADPQIPDDGLLDLVRVDAAIGCDLLVVPRLHDFHTQVGSADHIGAIPIMRVRRPALRGPSYALKRAFDLVLAVILLVCLSPLFAAVALAVRIEGGRTVRGVLFRQQRLTRDGRLFDVLKFRSMLPVDRDESDQAWNIAGDKRVGRVGRVIRRTSLDELPQIWNIVRGDMTFVGPRPERPYFAEQFSAEHRLYARRHRVVSGLTGLAQVSGLRGDTSISDRARFDNYYIENWSLWLDAKVLLRTISEVLGARGR